MWLTDIHFAFQRSNNGAFALVYSFACGCCQIKLSYEDLKQSAQRPALESKSGKTKASIHPISTTVQYL
jgi:hypothetical protein